MKEKIKDLILRIIELPSKFCNIFILRYRKVAYMPDLRIKGKMSVYGRGKIIIHENVRINSCMSANPIGGDSRTIFDTGVSGIIEIGAGTALSNCTIVSRKNIKIGNNVRIGGSCKIYDTDFHSLNLEMRLSKNNSGILSRSIIICDGAFVGAHSIILKGVTIGENSVVGAGSVVTKNIPSGEIWGGNPAHYIKKLEVTSDEQR